jgi:drug/metabolite transporter (DMT)-like permease
VKNKNAIGGRMKKKNSNIKGYIMVFASTMFFYIMTLFVKMITKDGRIPSTEVTFFRFLIGFIIVNLSLMKTGYNIKMVNKKAVLARGFFTALAILFFFMVIEYSTTTKANIYNLTYPIFVTIFGPLLLADERWTLKNMIGVTVAFIGVFLISGLALGVVSWVDALGLLQGFIAAAGIIALRKARVTDNSSTILFYLMSIGVIMSGIPFGYQFKVPTYREGFLLVGMGVFSYLGQYTLTNGFKYVKAVEGSLISSSRIFVAAICGILFLGEPFSITVLGGGSLIFIGIVLVSLKENSKKI